MNPGTWIRGASPERIDIREGRSNKEDKPPDSWPERLAFFWLLIVVLVRYIFLNMLLARTTIINPKYPPANVKVISLQPFRVDSC